MVYIYQLFAQSRVKSRNLRKRKEHAVLIIREPEPEPAGDPVIASAMAEAMTDPDIISFDDVLKRLRRPWWRRVLDKIIHPFRRR